eukprot:scaffold7585_cov74-Skeletonema_menzelii.AAC.2
MRCLLDLEEDSFSFQTCNDGLCATLLKLHITAAVAAGEKFQMLEQVKMMSDSALQKRMTHTDMVLTKLCSDMLQKSGIYVVGGISLGDLQRKMIQSAVTVEEIIGIFQEIDDLSKKEGTSYSPEEFAWFTVEAHNKAIQLSTVGDDARAKIYLTFALHFIEFSTKEVRCHKSKILKVEGSNVISRVWGLGYVIRAMYLNYVPSRQTKRQAQALSCLLSGTENKRFLCRTNTKIRLASQINLKSRLSSDLQSSSIIFYRSLQHEYATEISILSCLAVRFFGGYLSSLNRRPSRSILRCA